MLSVLKNLLKKVLPMPCKGTKREFNAVTSVLDQMKLEQRKAFRSEARLICDALEKTYAAVMARNMALERSVESLGEELKSVKAEISALRKECLDRNAV